MAGFFQPPQVGGIVVTLGKYQSENVAIKLATGV
jgi:hypothetical protein